MADWSHPTPSGLGWWVVLGAASSNEESGWGSWVLQQGSQNSWGCDCASHGQEHHLQNASSADRAFGENVTGIVFHPPGTEQDMFLSGRLCQPNWLSAPVARASLFLRIDPWCAWTSCFQDWSFPVLAFHPKPVVQISGLAWAGKRKNVLSSL